MARCRTYQNFQDEATYGDYIEFVSSPDYPQQLRRAAAKAYHPDRQPQNLRQKANDILARINAKCDELEGKK